MASDEAYLDVAVPIAALERAHLGAGAVPLQLLDTPGPNEAGEESLKFQVGGAVHPPGRVTGCLANSHDMQPHTPAFSGLPSS